MSVSDSKPPETAQGSSSAAPIDPKLLEILRCPVSGGRLVLSGQRLLCYESRKAYRIEDGIPVLLAEEAEELGDDEMAAQNRKD